MTDIDDEHWSDTHLPRLILEINEISLRPSCGGVSSYFTLKLDTDRETRSTDELLGVDGRDSTWRESFCFVVDNPEVSLQVGLFFMDPAIISPDHLDSNPNDAPSPARLSISMRELWNRFIGRLKPDILREVSCGFKGKLVTFAIYISFTITEASKKSHSDINWIDSPLAGPEDTVAHEPFTESALPESAIRVESLSEPDYDFDSLWDLIADSFGKSRTMSTDGAKNDWSGHILKGRLIGGGSFADVYEGDWTNMPVSLTTPPKVVVKVLRIHLLQSEDHSRFIRQLGREVKLWEGLNHPNIVPFIGSIHGFDERTKFPSMVSLFMSNGTLRSYVVRNPDVDHQPSLLGIARGLRYLHSFDPAVTHGDLNGSNILVDLNGRPRIGDFGLSRMLSNETLWVTSATSAPGTLRWMAPELLDGTQSTVTKQSDVWAYAMTSVEVMTGLVPFFEFRLDGAVAVAVTIRDERPKRPSKVSDELWAVWERCWTRDPLRRLTMDQVILRLDSVIVL